MQVILMESINNKNKIGELIDVKDGFARNFLIPQKKAMRATKANLAVFEERRAELEAKEQERRSQAEGIAAKFDEAYVCTIIAKADHGRLYGSINTHIIAEQIKADKKVELEHSQITLADKIHMVGEYEVAIVLHSEVSKTIKVFVEAEASADDEDESEKPAEEK